MNDALTTSMTILAFASYCRAGSSDALVKCPPGPEPVLVLCGFLSTNDSHLSRLLHTLHWRGDITSWAKGPPLSPEHPDSNISWSSKARRAQATQKGGTSFQSQRLPS